VAYWLVQKAQQKENSNMNNNQPVFVYNPDLCDPDKHLPPALRRLGDWARLLLDIIERRHLALDCIGSDFVCLHSKVLEEQLPKDVHYPVRTALGEGGSN
jgi:hypothetical protein